MMMGDMDHDDVREVLEDAAIEPGGLERLMAGDTAMASLVAGHLAGCPECAEELERLRRSVGLIRPTIRAVPPPELRERTLAFVAALGRPRGTAAAEETGPVDARPLAVVGGTRAPEAPSGRGRASLGTAGSRGGRLAVLSGIAAALIVAVTGTALLVGASRDSALRAQSAEIEDLGDVARWTLRVDGQPDVRRVELASADAAGATGTIVYSPGTTELVVVADGLARAGAGQEYRCWVEVGSVRTPIGRMFFGGDIAYWVGDVPSVAALGSDARFGVSLVDLARPDMSGRPVLVTPG
jgi:hypothetical protein